MSDINAKLSEAALYNQVVKVNVPMLQLEISGSSAEVASRLHELALIYGIGPTDVEWLHES